MHDRRRGDRRAMVPVPCPTEGCARYDRGAILCTVPASLGVPGVDYEVIEAGHSQPGDALYLCDECRLCGKRYCLKLLRSAA